MEFRLSRAPPQARHFAERVTAHEMHAKGVATKAVPASFRALEKIRPNLARLMGNAGFQALLSRALSLAILEIPSMRVVQVGVDGSLRGLAELAESTGPKELAEGGIALLAELLGLLVAFIGEQLTLRMMQEIWPKLSARELQTAHG